MNKNTLIGFGVVALVVLGGVYASMGNKETTMPEKPMEKSAVVATEDAVAVGADAEVKDEMVKGEEAGTAVAGQGAPVAMMKGSYEAYMPEKLAKAETGDVVLFFHASWCPSCRGLNSDIEANASLIPNGVSILKVDYDKEVELKKKYGVTTQHTLVQVDKDGNLIKKWSGGGKLANVVSEIQ